MSVTTLPTRGEVDRAAAAAAAMRPRLVVRAVGGGPKRFSRAQQESAQPANDPLHALVQSGRLLEPPYDPASLVTLREGSTILGQCIDAMKVNVEGHGFALEPAPGYDPATADAATLEEAERQRVAAQDFFDNLSLDMSWGRMRQSVREDLEALGWGALEVLRDTQTGALVGMAYVPAYRLRLGEVDDRPTKVAAWRRDPGTGRWTRKFFTTHLRRYAMVRGARVVWFKSLGDPRRISGDTGKVLPGGHPLVPAAPGVGEAHELLFFRLHSSRTPYGVPRWVGCSLTLGGLRQAEKVNLGSLLNNRIPPVIILTDAELDEPTLDNLNERFEELKGPDNFWRPLVLRGVRDLGALPMDALTGRPAPMLLQIEKLDRPGDGMFLEYDDKGRRKIQEAFRLPDLFVGKSEHTFATARAAMVVAEGQVFAPERRDMEWVINRRLLPELGVHLLQYRALGPDVTDPAALSEVMGRAADLGVGGSATWAGVVGRVLGVEVPPLPGLLGALPWPLLEVLLQTGAGRVVEMGDGTPALELGAAAGATPGQMGEAAERLRGLIAEAQGKLQALACAAAAEPQ